MTTTTPLAKREIHHHLCHHPENRLRIYAVGDRGANGDNHVYSVEHLDVEKHPAYQAMVEYCDALPDDAPEGQIVMFQQGDPEKGFNGFTIETLLAIAYDRLNGCQAGPFASEHNAQAMISINKALEHLHDRTREQLAAKENADG